jgi:sugar phosphate isomerase/epimerase
MRLGVVGMLPADFRSITPDQLQSIQSMNLTAACFHVAPEIAQAVTSADCQKTKRLYAEVGVNLPQMGINYGHCLFSPDAAVRDDVVRIIHRGIEVARMVEADVALIRPGSLNPAGSYAPTRKNHTPECLERLIETLRRVADKAEAEGQTIVIETYNLTIMNSPETNSRVVQLVGSDRIRIVMDFVNHFQSLAQVYNSTERINHIFDVMGAVCPIGHCKDISVGNSFAVHLNEDIPGEGELDLATALRRWHALHPNGYMLLEHIPDDKYPHDLDREDHKLLADAPHRGYALAARNVHRIAREAGVPIT